MRFQNKTWMAETRKAAEGLNGDDGARRSDSEQGSPSGGKFRAYL